MSASRWLLAAALAGACTLAAAGDPTPIGLKAGAFDPPQAAAEFPDGVRATDAGAARLARWRGKVVLLVFGFTHCPAVCPTTLATLAEARRLLGAGFDRSFVGATGEPQALALLRKRYGVTAQKVPAADGGADYAMSHSTSIYLIDRAGRLRALMPFGHSAADFAHDVRQLQALR